MAVSVPLVELVVRVVLTELVLVQVDEELVSVTEAGAFAVEKGLNSCAERRSARSPMEE